MRLLKQRVVAGTYAPGEQLKEEHIARELDISRTPIRAPSSGWWTTASPRRRSGRGVRVAEWTEFDIQETFELRGLLESHAAELAARRGGAHWRISWTTSTTGWNAPSRKGGDGCPSGCRTSTARFHRAILDASGSPRLRSCWPA
jgi:DNA-binding GntR family transcriptional regulator